MDRLEQARFFALIYTFHFFLL